MFTFIPRAKRLTKLEKEQMDILPSSELNSWDAMKKIGRPKTVENNFLNVMAKESLEAGLKLYHS